MKFKGWDWTELLRVWPESNKVKWPRWKKGEDPFREERMQAEWLRKRINELIVAVGEEMYPGGKLDRQNKLRVKNCRAFVAKVGSHRHGSDDRVFVEIAKVKDDHLFLQYLEKLLEWMWT